MKSLLTVENLSLRTSDRKILASGLGFAVGDGETLLITGPNGAGKTTLLRALVGLHRHYSGVVELGVGEDEIVLLPQTGNLRFLLPLNLRDVINIQGYVPDSKILSLGLLDLADLDVPWNLASGGERQKTLLCRVLLTPAKLYLLDEPLNHLDSASRLALLNILKSMSREGCGIVIVAHEFPPFENVLRLSLGGSS